MKPRDGGCAVDVEGTDGYAVVAQSIHEVSLEIFDAIAVNKQNDWISDLWIELTTLADPDTDMPRRPFWVRADKIIGLTYLPPEYVEKLETEIS